LIVLDASAALEVLLRSPASTRISARLFQTHETVHVPHLIDIEIAHVLRRLAARGLDAAVAGAALTDWEAMPVQRYPHDLLLDRVWSLRSNYTAYDAIYIALAEALDAPLVTHDRKLLGEGHSAVVEVI
jgi:predicted nucleic acid-binding protein